MNDVMWRKSSFTTNGSCVELAWRKSSYTNGTRVELAEATEAILVRNSNHPDAGTLTLDAKVVTALIEDVKAGRLDAHT